MAGEFIKKGISVSIEDIVDTTPDPTKMPNIPAEKPLIISDKQIVIKNISNSSREIDLGRNKEIRIDAGKEATVSESVLEHENYKAFASSFIIKGAK